MPYTASLISSGLNPPTVTTVNRPWEFIAHRAASILDFAPGYTDADKAYVMERCQAIHWFWRAMHGPAPMDFSWFAQAMLGHEEFLSAARTASDFAPLRVAQFAGLGHGDQGRANLFPLYRQMVFVVGSFAS